MNTAFLLSSSGSGRATAYLESSKIISHAGKTHVAWLDTPPEGFRVKMRTLDQVSGEWSAEVTIGEAIDNHGGGRSPKDALISSLTYLKKGALALRL